MESLRSVTVGSLVASFANGGEGAALDVVVADVGGDRDTRGGGTSVVASSGGEIGSAVGDADSAACFGGDKVEAELPAAIVLHPCGGGPLSSVGEADDGLNKNPAWMESGKPGIAYRR